MRYLLVLLGLAAFALTGCDSCGESTSKTYQPTASVLLAVEPFYCTQLEKTFKDVDAEALVTSIVGGQFVFMPRVDTPECPDYLPATITFGPLASCHISVPKEEDDSWSVVHSSCKAITMFALYFTPVESEVGELRYEGMSYTDRLYFKFATTPSTGITCEVYNSPEDFPQDGSILTINCEEQHSSVDHLYSFVWHAPQ